MKRQPSTSTTRLSAWSALEVGDRVQKAEPRTPLSPNVEDDSPGGCRERIVLKHGTVISKELSPGGLPEVWVQFDEERVPVPETPERLSVIASTIASTSAASLQRQEVAAA